MGKSTISMAMFYVANCKRLPEGNSFSSQKQPNVWICHESNWGFSQRDHPNHPTGVTVKIFSSPTCFNMCIYIYVYNIHKYTCLFHLFWICHFCWHFPVPQVESEKPMPKAQPKPPRKALKAMMPLPNLSPKASWIFLGRRGADVDEHLGFNAIIIPFLGLK